MKSFPIMRVIGITLYFVFLDSFAASIADLMGGRFDATSRAARVEIAADIRSRITPVLESLSPPSPSELEWLDVERKAIRNLPGGEAKDARMLRLSESVEFQHEKLFGVLRNTDNALSCILREDVPLREEISCWAYANLMLNEQDIGYASELLMEKRRLPDVGHFYFMFPWYAEGIQENIVIPYLRHDLE